MKLQNVLLHVSLTGHTDQAHDRQLATSSGNDAMDI